jgi:hypothetical protein
MLIEYEFVDPPKEDSGQIWIIVEDACTLFVSSMTSNLNLNRLKFLASQTPE